MKGDYCQANKFVLLRQVFHSAFLDLHLGYETVEPYPLEIENGVLRQAQDDEKYVVPPSGGSVTIDNDAGLVALSSVEMSDKTGHVLASSFDSAQDDTERSKQNRINAGLHIEKNTLCLRASVSLNSNPKPKLKADKEQGIIFIDENTTIRGIPPEAWQYKLGNRSALEWIFDQYKEKKPKDSTIAKLFNTYKFADYKDKVIDLLLRVTTVSIETMKIIRSMEKT